MDYTYNHQLSLRARRAWQSDEVVARAKPVAISGDPSLCSGQGLLHCLRKENSMDASESAWGFDFGVMSLRYKSERYQLPTGS